MIFKWVQIHCILPKLSCNNHIWKVFTIPINFREFVQDSCELCVHLLNRISSQALVTIIFRVLSALNWKGAEML